VPTESITSGTTNATKSTTSKSESEEKEKTAEDEIHSTIKNVYIVNSNKKKNSSCIVFLLQ
jgi:hypothetical protein